MGSFTDYLENELLDHVWSAAAYTPGDAVCGAVDHDNCGRRHEHDGALWGLLRACGRDEQRDELARGFRRGEGERHGNHVPDRYSGLGHHRRFRHLGRPYGGKYAGLRHANPEDYRLRRHASFAIGEFDITLT